VIDRSAIMGDAHRRYRAGKRLGLGWSFGQCLATAWAAAKARAAIAEAETGQGLRFSDSAVLRRSDAKPHSTAFSGSPIAVRPASVTAGGRANGLDLAPSFLTRGFFFGTLRSGW
jgi:hypothetical protein